MCEFGGKKLFDFDLKLINSDHSLIWFFSWNQRFTFWFVALLSLTIGMFFYLKNYSFSVNNIKTLVNGCKCYTFLKSFVNVSIELKDHLMMLSCFFFNYLPFWELYSIRVTGLLIWTFLCDWLASAFRLFLSWLHLWLTFLLLYDV